MTKQTPSHRSTPIRCVVWEGIALRQTIHLRLWTGYLGRILYTGSVVGSSSGSGQAGTADRYSFWKDFLLKPFSECGGGCLAGHAALLFSRNRTTSALQWHGRSTSSRIPNYRELYISSMEDQLPALSRNTGISALSLSFLDMVTSSSFLFNLNERFPFIITYPKERSSSLLFDIQSRLPSSQGHQVH